MGHHDGVIDVEGQVPAPGQMTQRSADLGRLAGYFSAEPDERGFVPQKVSVPVTDRSLRLIAGAVRRYDRLGEDSGGECRGQEC